ncbi:MAG TPA: AAA family ATPase [Candidatus Binataceae bacterium]|nr:AAA family ATPase [Candidatus Binataceae bacterium]
MTYYQWFRLKGPPFQPASPDAAVYFSPTHLAGLTTLEAGLSGELTGLTMLTGEAGTGKTTLIYALLQRDYKRVRIAHIDDPSLSFLEIMRLILTQLNLYSIGSTKLDYLEALDKFLRAHGQEERIAVVVDEAQMLSDEVLEELRLLSGHNQRHNRNLQLILVGQPELAERLKKPELRALNQRISTRGVLKQLNLDQGVKYVECKLSAQGGKCATVFENGALKRLLKRSDGIPRKINMLCHTAMQAAFEAGEKKVSVKTAKKIAEAYHESVATPKSGLRARLIQALPPLVVGASLVLLIGLIFPNFWSSLTRSGSSGPSVERSAQQTRVSKQTKVAEASKAVEQSRPVRQASIESVAAKPKADPSSAFTQPAASAARAAAEPAAAGSKAVKSPATSDMGLIPSAHAEANLGAATQKPAVTPAAASQRSQVTVQYGDTLEKIAIRYLGSSSGINALVKANPQVTDINQLNVGEVIYLPPGVAAKAKHD